MLVENPYYISLLSYAYDGLWPEFTFGARMGIQPVDDCQSDHRKCVCDTMTLAITAHSLYLANNDDCT